MALREGHGWPELWGLLGGISTVAIYQLEWKHFDILTIGPSVLMYKHELPEISSLKGCVWSGVWSGVVLSLISLSIIPQSLSLHSNHTGLLCVSWTLSSSFLPQCLCTCCLVCWTIHLMEACKVMVQRTWIQREAWQQSVWQETYHVAPLGQHSVSQIKCSAPQFSSLSLSLCLSQFMLKNIFVACYNLNINYFLYVSAINLLIVFSFPFYSILPGHPLPQINALYWLRRCFIWRYKGEMHIYMV